MELRQRSKSLVAALTSGSSRTNHCSQALPDLHLQLALRLKVPVKAVLVCGRNRSISASGSTRPRRIRQCDPGPLGIHRATGRRYWFYGADYRLGAQLDYLERLRKITETEMGGSSMASKCRKSFARRQELSCRHTIPLAAISHPRSRRPTSTRAGNYWARCPSCADHGRDRSGDNLAISVSDRASTSAGPVHQRDDTSGLGTSDSSQEVR